MFKFWSYEPTHDSYTGIHDTADRLPCGLYEIRTNSYGQPVAKRLQLRKDAMMVFQTGPQAHVLSEIQKFWAHGEHYKRLGVSHKRGILLHGPPGCGKTGIISVIIENAVKQNGIVFQVNRIDDFQDALPLTRQIEHDRPVVAIFEDIENAVAYDESALLEVMDGASSLGDNILFVATTNHLDKVPPRIRSRPSRIDTLIEIGLPGYEQRLEYMNFLLGKDKENHPLERWAKETDNLSLAAVKEFVISIRIYGKTAKETISKLHEMMKEGDD